MVKMDIEGAEFEILTNAYPLSFKKMKFLSVELHNKWADKLAYDALIEKLSRFFVLDGEMDGSPEFSKEGRYISIFATRKG
jgi:hypothetical protein